MPDNMSDAELLVGAFSSRETRMERLKEILREPFAGIGKPEPLKHEYQGCWSRRIDGEHRVVYKVSGASVWLLQLRFHY